jgi:tetratricopeptide (TPR) repeat protein
MPQVTAKPASRVVPPNEEDALSLAADCIEQGNLAAAARHLEKHVQQHPDQVVFRAQLADLCVRLEKLPEAQNHFERAAAQAQDGPPIVQKELVHYHTRLMEIGQQREDEYAERLHRGIGLYLVAAGLAARGSDPSDVERLMCKAAAALGEAHAKRPDDARPAWYLYRVWTHLEQPRPAAKALKQAVAAAPFSFLTTTESRELAMLVARDQWSVVSKDTVPANEP